MVVRRDEVVAHAIHLGRELRSFERQEALRRNRNQQGWATTYRCAARWRRQAGWKDHDGSVDEGGITGTDAGMNEFEVVLSYAQVRKED